MRTTTHQPRLLNALLTGICFLLTSTAYLAWTYHIMELAKAPLSDAITLIIGYLFQAAGVGLFSLFTKYRKDQIQISVYIVLGLHMVFMIPAVLSAGLVQAAVFGSIMNLLCGWIAGYYLYRLTTGIKAAHSAMTLGIGYSAAIIISWLLSLIGDGYLYNSWIILIICFVFSMIAALIIRMKPRVEEDALTGSDLPVKSPPAGEKAFRTLLILAVFFILLISMVNSCGFGFPSGDVMNGISLEFSRLFYAAGLLLAGFVNDRNRRHGAICAVIALVVPFIMLAIKGEPVSMMIFWILSYFTFGFYSIYRMILFSDIAREKGLIYLCGFGLFIGRIGDAAGEAVTLTLSGLTIIMIAITATLFMAAVILFFRVYQYIYLPETKMQRSEREIFQHFSERHDLSSREREVLRFLLEEKTNKEIADALSISEGTVKYHIHNLLQKTSCSNRLDLLAAFSAEQDI
ncbi:MAG: hypothetical protein E7233_05520 [Lachnospiraceae bacterium]|nr:hypothetical protein [Lachnospiraceae bacterium]